MIYNNYHKKIEPIVGRINSIFTNKDNSRRENMVQSERKTKPKLVDQFDIMQMSYSTKTRTELIQICREKKIKGYSGKNKNEIKELLLLLPDSHIKSQRKTKNLGVNTTKTQDQSYAEIESIHKTAKCSDGNHQGDRILPVRMFYLNKGGKALQGACITCQKNRRANRIKRSRQNFEGKSKEEIYEMYLATYGQTKTCSKCKSSKPPSEFQISLSMETGLHNHCILCSIGNSQGNGGLRDFIFMPDKDGIKYKKKNKCERCNGTNKLAVDHILPIAKGGTDCILNKQTLCINCNSKKNDTIDCAVTPEFLSARYKDDSLDFTDNMLLSRILSKKVYEFRQKNIEDASLETIRNSVKTYAKNNNLGHNLERIIRKIAILFNKS